MLLIEDDAAMRALLGDVLQRAGHRVINGIDDRNEPPGRGFGAREDDRPGAQEWLMSEFLRFAIWGFTAFWFWLGFALVFTKARIPYAGPFAAVLSWIGAGLLTMWMMSLAA